MVLPDNHIKHLDLINPFNVKLFRAKSTKSTLPEVDQQSIGKKDL